MSYGFSAVNNAGQVLVSSDTRNLHFAGKANHVGTKIALNSNGGCRQWVFQIVCKVVPVPFFTMPTGDYYGVTGLKNIGGDVWQIEITRSGTSDVLPEVYVFSDPRGLPTPIAETYGMQVMNNDGSVGFDSRMSPLLVNGLLDVTPPPNQLSYYPGNLSADACSSGIDHFAPDVFNSYPAIGSGTKPIYMYNSLGQAEREFSFSREQRDCTGVNAYGACLGYSEVRRWYSRYWAFYRAGIKRHMGAVALTCGWIATVTNCNYSYSYGGSLGFIGVNNSSNNGGAWPYANETHNWDKPVSIITSDGSIYD